MQDLVIMRQLKIKYILLFFLFSDSLFAQSSEKLKSLFLNEYELVQLYFNSALYMTNNLDTNDIEILDKTVYSLKCEYQLSAFAEILRVRVKYKNVFPRGDLFEVQRDVVFDYYVLNYRYWKLLRLFGFLVSDIQIVHKELDSIFFLNCIIETLTRNKILTKVQANLFKKDVLSNSNHFNKKIAKPVNLLLNNKSNIDYQSKILPYDLIKLRVI